VEKLKIGKAWKREAREETVQKEMGAKTRTYEGWEIIRKAKCKEGMIRGRMGMEYYEIGLKQVRKLKTK